MKVSVAAALGWVGLVGASAARADMPVPHQRPGLWETTMTMMGKPYVTQSCVSEESAAKSSVFSSQLRRKNCSASAATRNADGSWSSVSTCSFGNGAPHTTRVHVTGDFNSKVTMVVSTDGSGRPDTTMTMVWQGACKPGMRGGDVIMPNGMKINVMDGMGAGGAGH